MFRGASTRRLESIACRRLESDDCVVVVVAVGYSSEEGYNAEYAACLFYVVRLMSLSLRR